MIYSQINNAQTVESVPMNVTDISEDDTLSSKSLFRLVGIKLLILTLFCSIFVVSLIISM